MNKKKRRYNLIIKEENVGFKVYKFKSHGGVMGILFFILCLTPLIPLNFLQSLIAFPVFVIVWDLLSLGAFYLFIKLKHRKLAKKSDNMRE